MQTIKSIEKLASTNTHGLCNVKRTIVSNRENRNRVTGELESITLVILSRKFKEQTITIDQDEVTERLYVTGQNQLEKDHEHAWTFTVSQIDSFKSLLSTELEGKNYEEKQLIIFTAQTKIAGKNGGGWQNMSDWVWDDDTKYIEVKEFTPLQD